MLEVEFVVAKSMSEVNSNRDPMREQQDLRVSDTE